MNQKEIKKITIKTNAFTLGIHTTKQGRDLHHILSEMLEFDVYNLNRQHFQKGDVVVDIGANIGIFSIILSKRFPDVTIYAFEPSLINYELLIRNIEENNITNIEPYRLLVDKDSDKETSMRYIQQRPGCSGVYAKEGTPEKVITISLDDIITRNNIKKIKYLKIDCEGSEYDIIPNSQAFNREMVEYLGIETHNIAGEDHRALTRYVIKKLGKTQVTHMFGNVIWGRNSIEIMHKLAGLFGILLKGISPSLYKTANKIKEKIIRPTWQIL